ncbi:uncharacterized protein [Nicotiana tomentosiformis]|uniref:uncharacterized protein n=1 Tax=Nicotiana tomentosiformis TaxID=4098 RepID=UPI00388C4248
MLLHERAPRTLPSDTEKNPKEIIKVVSLRSSKTLANPVVKARPEVVNNHTETVEEKKGQSSGVHNEIEERKKLDKCFGWFLEMLKQLSVNISFTEVLTHMPAYTEFWKEILSSKRKIEETTMVKLNFHCSAILQNKIPQKCGEPGSFTIPWSLGSEKFDKALCDSGASINLMPLSMFKKLEADQTTIFPDGIIEDILVRVDKFVFPVDFIMVDMEVNKEVPLVLGRPFLCTYRAIIDIYEGKLMLRVVNEKVVFPINMMMKNPSDEASAYSCFKLDVVRELAEKYKLDKLAGDTLEKFITRSSIMEDEDTEMKKEVEALEIEDQVGDEEELNKEGF